MSVPQLQANSGPWKGRKNLPGHQVLMAKPSGVPSVIFGLAFLGVGGAMAFFAWLWLSDPASPPKPSKAILGVVGAILASIGINLLVGGVRGLARRIRSWLRRRDHPAEPWIWDYPWNPAGARLSVGRKTVTGFIVVSLATLLVLPFHAFNNRAIYCFDGIVLLWWLATLYVFTRNMKYGGSLLRFARSPFVLGQELEVFFQGADRLRNYESMTWTLRCVEEIKEVYKRGNSTTISILCYGVYEHVRTLEPGEITFGLGDPARFFQLARREDAGSEMRITFPLPKGSYETHLSKAPLRYWELEIVAKMPGVDYEATFLLPVYAKAG